MPENVAWYAVHTRSNYESKVRSLLADKQIETYLPVFREVRQWKDRKKLVELPLFRGYVFVLLADSRESRLSVVCTDGVVRILGTSEGIEVIPETEIEAIRRLLDSSRPCQSHPLLREGAWVRVTRGSLRNMQGLLVRIKNRTRFVISIPLLSQSVSTEIDASDVQFLRSAVDQTRRIA